MTSMGRLDNLMGKGKNSQEGREAGFEKGGAVKGTVVSKKRSS